MKKRALTLAAFIITGLFLLAGTAAAQPAVVESVPAEIKLITSATKQLDVSNNMGSPRVSEEEAMKILREAFPELNNEGEPDINYENDTYLGRNLWNIFMHEQSRYINKTFYNSYDAAVDADSGEILRMSANNPATAEGDRILTRQEALAVAEKLVKKLQPEKFKQMRLQSATPEYYYPPGNLNLNHSFYWARTENGVIVDGDGINLSVDPLSGQITDYNFTWRPDIKLSSQGTVLPAGEVAEKVVSELGMALVYHVPRRSYTGAVPQAKLIYQINGGYQTFSPATGKAVDNRGIERELEESRKYDITQAIKGINNPPPSSGSRISPEKALESAKQFFRLMGIEGELERDGGGSTEGPLGKQEYWDFRVVENNDNPSHGEPGVNIDNETGQVVSFYNFGAEDVKNENSPTLTSEEALKKAKEFISKASPDYSRHVVAEKTDQQWYFSDSPGYSFSFYRVVNGIPFPQDGIYIGMGTDGKIHFYSCEWHRVSFPEPDNPITPEEAALKWLETSTLKLAYITPWEEGKQSSNAFLSYRWDDQDIGIDALTGELLTDDGLPLKKQSHSGYNIEQSWAAQQLEMLARSGLLPPPAQFSPANPARKRDVARVLTSSMRNYYDDDGKTTRIYQDINQEDPDFDAIQYGAMLGIFDKGGNFSPENTITRLDLARWLVNAIGYGEVAKMDNTIISSFSDIKGLSPVDRNYVGLAQGLGIMQGDQSGKFNPTDQVTWEELAAVAIKVAPRLRNLTANW